MATKYFCDGCDVQIFENNKIHVSFTIPIGMSHRDLCSDCADKFDPLKWPRIKGTKNDLQN